MPGFLASEDSGRMSAAFCRRHARAHSSELSDSSRTFGRLEAVGHHPRRSAWSDLGDGRCIVACARRAGSPVRRFCLRLPCDGLFAIAGHPVREYRHQDLQIHWPLQRGRSRSLDAPRSRSTIWRCGSLGGTGSTDWPIAWFERTRGQPCSYLDGDHLIARAQSRKSAEAGQLAAGAERCPMTDMPRTAQMISRQIERL